MRFHDLDLNLKTHSTTPNKWHCDHITTVVHWWSPCFLKTPNHEESAPWPWAIRSSTQHLLVNITLKLPSTKIMGKGLIWLFVIRFKLPTRLIDTRFLREFLYCKDKKTRYIWRQYKRKCPLLADIEWARRCGVLTGRHDQ